LRSSLDGGIMDASTAPLPLNLVEYEAAAKALLPVGNYGYVAGAACDEVTLRANREAFGQWRLLPRMLRGISEVRLATTVLGQEIALPVLLAPTAMHTLMHPDGELASARAARGAGRLFMA